MKFQAIIFLVILTFNNVYYAQNLFIDWSAGFDSEGRDMSGPVTLDGDKNVYSTGMVRGRIDFDPGLGIQELVGSNFIYISKLDSTGAFVWAKQINSSGQNSLTANGIKTDSLGNIYLTGEFEEMVDFDPGSGIFNLQSEGITDVYVAKYSSFGELIWAKRIGNQYYSIVYDLELDRIGNVYLTGFFSGQLDFDPGDAVYYLEDDNGYDPFIMKLDSSGNFIWARQFRGYDDNAYITSLAVDNELNVYSTGQYSGWVDFDPGIDTVEHHPANIYAVFLSKLDSSGNFVWIEQFETRSAVNYSQIAISTLGDIILSGIYLYTVDIDPGNDTLNLNDQEGSGNIFALSVNSEGILNWARSFGGLGSEYLNLMTLDLNNSIYLSGTFNQFGDFDHGLGENNLFSLGLYDVFILKLDIEGNLEWAKSTGSAGSDYPGGIAVNQSDNVYLNVTHDQLIGFSQNQDLMSYNPQGESGNIILHFKGDLALETTQLQKREMTIFPNPVQNQLNIFYPELINVIYKLQLTDVSGKIILKENDIVGPNHLIKMSMLPSGLYFLDITLNDRREQFKITKL